MKVSVVSPERVLFDGEASALVVPAYDGLIGILPRHAAMLALLGKGILKVRLKEGGEQRFRLAGGFVQVRANTVRLVAEDAVAVDFGGPSSQ
jgi:F-type H+-transporting ATPase subunit epsilon